MDDRNDNPTTLAPHPDTIDGAGAAYGVSARVLLFHTFEECANYADRSGLGIRAVQDAGGTGYAITLPAGSLDAALHDLMDAEGHAAA